MWIGLLPFLLAPQCVLYHSPPQDTDEPEEIPALEVFPNNLKLEASLYEGHPVLGEFTVLNNLDDELDIWGFLDVVPKTDEDVACAPAQFDVFSPAETPFPRLAGGARMTFTVTFTPSADEFCGAEIGINNGIRDEVPELTVGLGGYSLRPRLSYTAFPDMASQVGCEVRDSFTLRNAFGTEPLLILDHDTSGMRSFSLPEGLPASVPTGGEVEIPLDFRPVAVGTPDEPEVLILYTNDPDQQPFLNVGLHGTGTDDLTRSESFHYSAGDGIQVLLVVDDEDDEAAYMSRIEYGLEDLVDGLREAGIAYNIAAVSTEDGCPGENAFVTHHETAEEAVDALDDAIFDDADTPYSDRLLELTRVALESTDPDECLDGFIEPDQPLHVVLFSPREDASDAGYVAELAAIQDSHDDVTFSAVVPFPGESCGITPQSYSWAAYLTGGELLNLCARPSAWAGHWRSVVATTSALESGPTTWTLAEPVVDDTVEVIVDGLLLSKDDWGHDPSTNTVRFVGTPPRDGAEVTVRYTPVDACP